MPLGLVRAAAAAPRHAHPVRVRNARSGTAGPPARADRFFAESRRYRARRPALSSRRVRLKNFFPCVPRAACVSCVGVYVCAHVCVVLCRLSAPDFLREEDPRIR